jgi:hypothetical protein
MVLALVDGVPAAVWAHGGRPEAVFTFTISDGKITGIALDGDPGRIRDLDIVFSAPAARSGDDPRAGRDARPDRAGASGPAGHDRRTRAGSCGAGRVRGRRRGLLLADGRGAGPRLARRLRNLDRDQRVTILAGFYDEDCPKVGRFRLRGTGRRESGAHACDRPAGAGVPAVRRRPPPRLVAGYWRSASRAGPAGRIAGFDPGTAVQQNTFGMADRTAAVVMA